MILKQTNNELFIIAIAELPTRNLCNVGEVKQFYPIVSNVILTPSSAKRDITKSETPSL